MICFLYIIRVRCENVQPSMASWISRASLHSAAKGPAWITTWVNVILCLQMTHNFIKLVFLQERSKIQSNKFPLLRLVELKLTFTENLLVFFYSLCNVGYLGMKEVVMSIMKWLAKLIIHLWRMYDYHKVFQHIAVCVEILCTH